MNFEEALKRYWDDFVHYSHSLAGSSDRGDDLLQESLIRAWHGYEKLTDHNSFKQWVLKIISNTHKSQCRLVWLKRLVGIEALETEPTPEELPYEEKELVRLSLRNLPEKQREALILFEVLGMSVMEIAEIQKVTLSAVKSRLARGREALQKRYHQLDGMSGQTRSNKAKLFGSVGNNSELTIVPAMKSPNDNSGISRSSL